MEEQPIVLLGDEGAWGIVASNLNDYLWLLAGGHGPDEGVFYMDQDADNFDYSALKNEPNQELTELAEKYAPKNRKTPAEVVAAAHKAFPEFNSWMNGMVNGDE